MLCETCERFPAVAYVRAHRKSRRRAKNHIPPELVVNRQVVDIFEVISSPIWQRNIVQTSCRNRKWQCEPLTSEVHRSTTNSGCAVKASWGNVARPERMQVRSEPLELLQTTCR